MGTLAQASPGQIGSSIVTLTSKQPVSSNISDIKTKPVYVSVPLLSLEYYTWMFFLH